jgi:DNA-directed RNA polymerase specialized sigma24 family protein
MAELSDVVKRLDAITALLVFLLPEPSERRSLRDQIKLFDEAGLAPSEIAKIIDRPQPAVNSELARIRGKKAKKRGTKE